MTRAGVRRAALAASFCVASAAAAQTPTWTTLAPLGELVADPISSELVLPSLLTRAPPRVGLFWTAGLPAGLAREVAGRRAAFDAGSQSSSGEYRRPLEASTHDAQGLNGEAWGLLGSRGGAYGRLGFQMMDMGDGAFGNVVRPYGAEPYMVADTVGEPLSAFHVEIEGAGGWRIGRLLVGVGVGLAQRETRTVESPVPIFNRWSEPAAVASAAWDFGPALQVGAIGRWQIETEFLNVLSLRAPSRLYRFQGYEEPIPINLSANLWARRFERSAGAAGGAAAGELFGFAWAAYLQRETRSSENYDVTGLGERIDRWNVKGWRGGGAIQRRFRGILFTLDGQHLTLSGDAVLADLPDDIAFEADDARTAARLEARLLPWNGWEAALSIGVARETRHRYDELVGVTSDVRAWRPSGALEVARRMGQFSASVAAARVEHNPSGSVPLFAAMDPIYQKWLAPGVAFDAALASAHIIGATLRWQARRTTAFWLGAWHRTAQVPDRLPADVPARPLGSSSETRLGLGIVLN